MTDRSAGDSHRHHFPRIGRVIGGLVSAMAVIGLIPTVASGAVSGATLGRSLTNGTVQQVTSVSAPPGSVAWDSRVTTSNSSARSIVYWFDSDTSASKCTDVSGGTTHTINVVVPRAPGTHDLHFQAFNTGAGVCPHRGSAAEFTLRNAVTVDPPARNPPLVNKCAGLNVVLVLDESYSIVSPTDFRADVRSAALAFLEALSGTGSRVAIVAFHGTARTGVNYTLVNPSSINDIFKPFIGTGNASNPGGYNPSTSTAATNWQAAFNQVRTLNSARRADLAVFLTDGDPNTITTQTGGTHTFTPPSGGKTGVIEAMEPAWAAANVVKEQLSRVFAVGVGAAANPESAARLTAVSGDREFPQDGALANTDYTLVHSFDALADSLRRLVTEACAPSVTITKWVRSPGETVYTHENPGWDFTGTLTVVPPGHHWVDPEGGSTAAKVTATTNADGVASFKWEPTNPHATSTLDVTETQQSGYSFQQTVCTIHRPGGTETLPASPTGVPRLSLGPDEYATCAVYNQGPTATLTVVKRLIPDTDPGRFDLLVDGQPKAFGVPTPQGDTTGPLTLPAGIHEVSERVAEGSSVSLDDYNTTTECVDETHDTVVEPVRGDAPVPVTLTPGSVVICWITNARKPLPTATLEVVKHLSPTDDGGRFDLLLDGEPIIEQVGHNQGTGPLTVGVGTYEVSERITEADAPTLTPADYSTSTSCVNAAGTKVASGVGTEAAPVSVTLGPGEEVVCTVTNARIAGPPGPTPPGPPVPPGDPCSDFDVHVPDCAGDVNPPTAPQTRLSIDKTMPAHAHVGQIVPIRITVKNVGSDTAHNVIVRDTPPGAGRLVHVTGGTLNPDGTATWHLGDLAPGEARTVQATMRIITGGTLENVSLASAANTDVVNHPATVAAALRRRPPPPPRFTG